VFATRTSDALALQLEDALENVVADFGHGAEQLAVESRHENSVGRVVVGQVGEVADQIGFRLFVKSRLLGVAAVQADDLEGRPEVDIYTPRESARRLQA
jgi:hypothetical protein